MPAVQPVALRITIFTCEKRMSGPVLCPLIIYIFVLQPAYMSSNDPGKPKSSFDMYGNLGGMLTSKKNSPDDIEIVIFLSLYQGHFSMQ